ncbi:hypothetical protein HMPREF0063_10705 [Aeromicrobium marinum DSM 15272]|uniref:Uncharacterized protein n=1 Tax=Aeromicrobium marinum DSM 15272 TaxID=585531 RepID=E2S9R5_9ACTN|nr:hypothetical protein HMPREF0063_10705 [Aeromicrobium marinum DSM 15272]
MRCSLPRRGDAGGSLGSLKVRVRLGRVNDRASGAACRNP